MTQGHRGWLALQCANPSFAARRRFIPAHFRKELLEKFLEVNRPKEKSRDR